MERLFVDSKYEPMFAAKGWDSFSRVVAHFLPDYTKRRKMTVQRVTVPTPEGPVDAFFKLYHLGSSSWSFSLRRSKARCEFENYAVFKQLGMPAAERIACGEERGFLGRLHRAFIITRAVPDACELEDFFRAGPPRAEQRQLLHDLAELVRKLHAAHFYYFDLVWRNILVSRDDGGRPRVFLIDCPRGGLAQIGRRTKSLRDLASLDKSAARLCSRPERMRFLASYLGRREVDDEVRALARACMDYRRARWPHDWMGK